MEGNEIEGKYACRGEEDEANDEDNVNSSGGSNGGGGSSNNDNGNAAGSLSANLVALAAVGVVAVFSQL
jgi:hypothetical protein